MPTALDALVDHVLLEPVPLVVLENALLLAAINVQLFALEGTLLIPMLILLTVVGIPTLIILLQDLSTEVATLATASRRNR